MNPSGFLYSYMDTNVQGCRSVTINSVVSTVTAGYFNFHAFVTNLNSALTGSWTASFSTTTGLVTLDGTAASHDLTFNDRIGVYLGFQHPATYSLTAGYSYTSTVPPPGCLHLLGAMWEDIDMQRERVLEQTRLGRGFGYVWGGATVWSWNLSIHPRSIMPSATGTFTTDEPLLSSFVTQGKVRIWMGVEPAISYGASGGKLDAHVLSFDGIRRTSSMGFTSYEATLLVCS